MQETAFDFSPAAKTLILASVFVLSVVATVFGYTSAGTTRQKIAAFASDSAATTGIVTNWQITNVARSPEYWLDVNFKTRDGSTHQVSERVQKPVFDSYNIGSSVPVTYVRSRPEWFYVADEVPTDRQATALDWLFRVGAVASVLSGLGLFVRFFNGSGGGNATRGAESVAQPVVPSVTPPRPVAPSGDRTPRPGGFGKRSAAE
jgi:hypothetical protein